MQDDTTIPAEAMAPRRVVLHLGAHKTASTHFNKLLRKNRALLKEHSVAVPRKDEIRKFITRRIHGNEPPRDDIPQDLAAYLAQGAKTLFLSDENILGTPRGLIQRGVMYPSAANNLRVALRLLGDAPLEIWLAVREPGSFATSSWGEAMRAHGYIDFKGYAGMDPLPALRWTQLVRRIKAAGPGVPLTIWSYERYRDLVPGLLADVLGVDSAPADKVLDIDTVVRPGLSQRAVEEIRALSTAGTGKQAQETFEQVVKAYPKSDAHPAPQPWSEQESAALKAQYAGELQRLSGMDGVRFLG